MRNLLSNTSKRQVEFLELLFEADDYMPVKEFATQIGCSTRILWNDIDYINENIDGLSITSSKKKGICLNYPTNYSLLSVYTYYLNNNVTFEIIELLLYKNNLSVDEIADKLFLSKSSVSRTLKKITDYFSSIHIHITSNLKIKGDEATIYIFYAQFLMAKYPLLLNSPFENELNAIEELLNYYFDQHFKKNDFLEVNELKILIFIAIFRYKENSKTTIFSSHNMQTKNRNQNDSYIKNIFIQTFNITLTDTMVQTFLKNMKQYSNLLNETTLNLLELQPKELPKKFDQPFEKLFKNLASFLELPTPPSALYKKLYKTHFINSKFNLSQNKTINDTGNYIKKNHFDLYHIIQDNYVNLPNFQFKGDETIDLNYFLYTIIVYWPNLLDKLSEVKTGVKIALFFKGNSEQILFVQKYLTHHLDMFSVDTIDILQAISIDDLNKKSIDYQILVTNIPSIECLSDYTFAISDIPTNNDLKRLGTLINCLS